MLKETLLQLIEERDYERITIEDITERADVARSTFYSQFGSKEELLFTGFDTWLLGLAEGDLAKSWTRSGAAHGSASACPFCATWPPKDASSVRYS